MPVTYIPIASQTLGTNTASVTFSNIPQTYRDLVLRMSVRKSGTTGSTLFVRANGDGTTTNKGFTNVRGDGSAASSQRGSAQVDLTLSTLINTSSDTTNTFTSVEFYLANYAQSAAKPGSSTAAQETDFTTAYLQSMGHITTGTAAITSLEVRTNAGDFATGSSFHLYGISNT